MKKQSLLVLSVLALAIYSCQIESVDILSKNEQLSANQARATRITNGCSAPYSGVNKGWVAGSFSLPTDVQSDKKYFWRTPSRPSIKFSVKLNTNYPITVRCIGVKGVLSETYELYDGCYELSANASTKEFSFNAPGSYNWLGNWIYTYDYFDFEIIVKNRNGAGKTNTVVPITISCCASQNGQCLGDELGNLLLWVQVVSTCILLYYCGVRIMRINKKIVIGIFVIVSLFLGYSYYHYFIKIIYSFHQTLIQDVVISQDIAGAEVISNDLGSVMLNSGDVIIVSASGSLSLAVSGRIILYGVQKNKGLYRIPLVYEYDGTQSNINAATDWGLGVIMGLIKFGDHLLFPHRIINSYSSLSLIGDDVVFSSGAIFSIQSSPRFLRLKDEIRSQLGGLGSCSGDGCETYERMIARLFYESHLIIQSMIYPSEFVNKPYDLFGFSGYIVPFDYIAPFDYSGFSSQSSWIVIKSAQNGTKVNYDILSKDPITLESKKSWLEKYIQLLNL